MALINVQCGEPLAQAGEETAQCGNSFTLSIVTAANVVELGDTAVAQLSVIASVSANVLEAEEVATASFSNVISITANVLEAGDTVTTAPEVSTIAYLSASTLEEGDTATALIITTPSMPDFGNANLVSTTAQNEIGITEVIYSGRDNIVTLIAQIDYEPLNLTPVTRYLMELTGSTDSKTIDTNEDLGAIFGDIDGILTIDIGSLVTDIQKDKYKTRIVVYDNLHENGQVLSDACCSQDLVIDIR